MLSPATTIRSEISPPIDALDRTAVIYLTLPVAIFLIGWFHWWVAVPLVACLAYSLRPLLRGASASTNSRFPVSFTQVVIAVAGGCAWTALGGADHLLFANADWHVRDAVLHDLVASPWPVGYGLFDGKESILRAPVAFYLPAALVGKGLGLSAAHVAMGIWTAAGATVFLLQVLSLVPSRLGVALMVTAVVILFSGLDIVGNLLNDGPRFRSDWNITTHLEWWAGKFQYSSNTTQLFWVPNHALGGWLTIGLLSRNSRNMKLDLMLPMIVVALALWSPLTAIGFVPFVLLRGVADSERGHWPRLLHPRAWAPALIVGLVIAAYLVLDPSKIPKGVAVGGGPDGSIVMDLLQQAQFFLLEAGFIGAAILAIRPSPSIALALIILALLPLVYLGPGNDLVMRASIPSLATLTIGACLALVGHSSDEARSQKTDKARNQKKAALVALLIVGAVTPIEEFARAILLPAWPINSSATLVGAVCGHFAPHYVARLDHEVVGRLMRPTNRLALGPQGPQACDNPAFDLMWSYTFLPRKDLRPSTVAKRSSGST